MKVGFIFCCLVVLCGCTNLHDPATASQADDVQQQRFIETMGGFPAYPAIDAAVFEPQRGIFSFYTGDPPDAVYQFYAEQLHAQGWTLGGPLAPRRAGGKTWAFDKPDRTKDRDGRTSWTTVKIQILTVDTKTYVELTKLTTIQERPFI